MVICLLLILHVLENRPVFAADKYGSDSQIRVVYNMANLIPAASIPAQDCFTRPRPHQTCSPTSFNRSCTGNDVLWSLLTLCAVSVNNNFWTRGRVKVACHFPFREQKFYIVFALKSESSRRRKLHLRSFRSRERGSESSSYRLEVCIAPLITPRYASLPKKHLCKVLYIYFHFLWYSTLLVEGHTHCVRSQ